ncbi:BQ2448_6917 [Microbotryum intermedium]|uniref:BQ2448_6917 protein n=1 Tax=Microbotryum intermedium TaxID=269621 RepID=A0A238FGQ4_9BASI|nr:BQ2448_6917 [Microbotryum intermedium]
MPRRSVKPQIIREYYDGQVVVQIRDDNSVVHKNYNNVMQGLNGLYKNPKFPEMKDCFPTVMYRLAMDYYRYH